MSQERMLGKYRLLEEVGRGGFSTVYRATNTVLGNEVALKVLNPVLARDKTFVQRFRREAKQTAQLDHPNIVRILDLDEADGQFFIAMEYVPNQDLREILASGELMPLEQVVSIIRQLGAALDYAHGHSLIHRDVKPGNVLYRKDGVVKLMDFGLVKASEGTKLTLTGMTMGTPSYMSPEQTRGAPVDGRADLYALGVMAYEFITGRVPFQGNTPVSTAYMHVHETPPLPSTIADRAKGPIEPVLLKALAKDPADRYQTGAALADALATAVRKQEEQSLINAYNQSVTLIQNRQFGAALEQLKLLQATQPDFRDVHTLILKAQEGENLNDLYHRAGQYLSSARDLASQITTADPDFPDTQNLFPILRGQPGKNALVHGAKTQQPATKQKKIARVIMKFAGQAAIGLIIMLVILVGVHLIFVRPSIEEAVFDFAGPNLDALVNPDVFQGHSEFCETSTERSIQTDLAQGLRGSPLANKIEIQLNQNSVSVAAKLGKLAASVEASPEVDTEAGLMKLGDFKINWLVKLFFSPKGLRTFVEDYVNNDILRDGRMRLEEITIDANSITVCVTPR